MATYATNSRRKNIAEQLGYSADAKLVILHADDLAMAHSVNQASFVALDQKAVSSASVVSHKSFYMWISNRIGGIPEQNEQFPFP